MIQNRAWMFFVPLFLLYARALERVNGSIKVGKRTSNAMFSLFGLDSAKHSTKGASGPHGVGLV